MLLPLSGLAGSVVPRGTHAFFFPLFPPFPCLSPLSPTFRRRRPESHRRARCVLAVQYLLCAHLCPSEGWLCAPMWAPPLRHKGGQRTPPPPPRPRRSEQHPLFPRTIHSRKNRPGFKSVRRAGGDGLLLLLHAATNACDDGGRGLCPIIPPCCTYVHTRGGGGGSQGPLPSLLSLSLSIPRDRPAAPTLIELESRPKRRQ